MSEENVISLEEIISPQADTESIVGAAGDDIAIYHNQACAPEENVVVERGEESPDGVPEEIVCGDRGVSDEESETEADFEDEDVDVVSGVFALVIYGIELKGFTFLQNRPEKKTGATDVVSGCCRHRTTSAN